MFFIYTFCMQEFYVYILRCRDNSYYTGHTDNIEHRISAHMKGNSLCYTATRLPIELVYVGLFASRYEALLAERQIKGWSRKKKEALIKSDWQEIIRLSNQKNLSKK